MDMTHHTFFAPCPRGLESVLHDELLTLGAVDPLVTPGGVGFSGSLDLCYRANLESRIASRILWRVAHGPYHSEEDLYQLAADLPWHQWFLPTHTIKVKVSAQQCPLQSLNFATLRIKDAICDGFIKACSSRPSVDTIRPDILIVAFLDERTATLYLDTSGDPLFKRGLRQRMSDAPLRENLAAGILRLAGWQPDQVLFDPMCGGATLPIEAAMIAHNIAPGLGRPFAFEKLQMFDKKVWADLCDHSRARQRRRAPAPIFASDQSTKAIQAAEANVSAAGLAVTIYFKQADFLTISPPADSGLLIANPPYGHRMGDDQEMARFYPLLGDCLKQRYAGWTAYLFTGDLRLPKLIGLSTSRRTPLFNGAIECRLYQFKLIAGGHRQRGASRQNDEETT
jgi:putative N6-adenine-specific DNA methylase